MDSFSPDPIYEFPPFFTKQPNEDSWKSQLLKWHRIVTEFCKFSGKWQVSYSSPVFANLRIQRQLPPEAVKLVLDDMVASGNAEQLGPSEVYVYAAKPSELAYELKQWAAATGHDGSVLTFYELQEGEIPGLERFKGIDSLLLKRLVKVLVKRGEAVGLSEDNEMVGLKLAS